MARPAKEPVHRLFFALWPREAEQSALAAWQRPLHELCGGRIMQAVTLHSTLVFLGNVAEHRLEALSLAAQETQFKPIELNLTAAHYWGHNHIVYAAPDVMPPALADLVNELGGRLRRHRFPIEDRAYKPHITLLRNARWTDAELPLMPAVRWHFRRFALVKSLSDEHGPKYEALAWFGASELE